MFQIDNIDISDKKGLNSKVYKTTITFDDIHNVPYVCILKIPEMGDFKALTDKVSNAEISSGEEPMDLNTVVKMHNREVLFLEQYSSDIKGLNFIQCFGTKEWKFGKEEGAILMEYIDNERFYHVNFFEMLTAEQAHAIMDQIIILQSHFYTLPDQSWKEKLPTVFTVNDFAMVKHYFLPNFENYKKLTDPKVWKDTETDILALLSHYSEAGTYIDTTLPYQKDNECVFVKCDLGLNNFFFDKRSKDVALLDFQGAHCGSIGHDLADFLVTNCSLETRKSLEKAFPQFYEKLKNEIESKGCSLKISYEKFIENYEVNLIVRALTKCMILELYYALNDPPQGSVDGYLDEKKKDQAFYMISALNDAVEAARKYKPEWLIMKE
uniref:CHK domain-containing protein n=1 Tax=Rhabditophanes sp. KR3021 TaxID=114890 RepID=A0AC35U9X5_9BILA